MTRVRLTPELAARVHALNPDLPVGAAYKPNNAEQFEDGIIFDSKAELRRYHELKALRSAGDIGGLRVHWPTYELQPGFRDRTGAWHRPITYTPDFSYIDQATGQLVIEDVKGYKTEMFRIKEKLLRFSHPDLDFRIVSHKRASRRKT